MNLLSSMLGVIQFKTGTTYAWLNGILKVLNDVLVPILIVVGAVGTIYAIYLGVMMAKAENAEKREESKKRIINAIIALAVVVVLVLLMKLFTSKDILVNILGVDTNDIESGLRIGLGL